MVRVPFVLHELDVRPYLFGTYVDSFVSDPFLPDEPIRLLREGRYNHVPMILGANRDEGTMFALDYATNETMFEEHMDNLDVLLPAWTVGR